MPQTFFKLIVEDVVFTEIEVTCAFILDGYVSLQHSLYEFDSRFIVSEVEFKISHIDGNKSNALRVVEVLTYLKGFLIGINSFR